MTVERPFTLTYLRPILLLLKHDISCAIKLVLVGVPENSKMRMCQKENSLHSQCRVHDPSKSIHVIYSAAPSVAWFFNPSFLSKSLWGLFLSGRRKGDRPLATAAAAAIFRWDHICKWRVTEEIEGHKLVHVAWECTIHVGQTPPKMQSTSLGQVFFFKTVWRWRPPRSFCYRFAPRGIWILSPCLESLQGVWKRRKGKMR